jgi:hypothetical protein
MPAVRKPTKVLEASGAYKHDPQRRRDPEPEPTGPLGEAPEGLKPGAVKAWNQIAKSCGGWLTDADRMTAEVAAVLMDKFRRQDYLGVELVSLRAALGALGMDPASRSKISVVKEKPKNQFADLAAESRSLLRPN